MGKLPGVVIYLDKLQVSGLDDRIISQDRISLARNFLMISGPDQVLGFHDHPREMWIERKFLYLAEEMQSQGWLAIESMKYGQ